ncbi:hypothetical protein KW783_01880, partial [Candidatus Parcubacteria bacterium]|nr:hypothetical protein [Candidatus Parcubacteria bacterium]
MDRLLTALIKYRYVALFPLAAIEGPVVALAAGVLIHFGYLAVIPSYIILILGDIIPDTVYYYIGRYSHKINLVEKYKLKSVFISTNLDFMDRLWRDHGRKTMFLAKLAY